MYRMFEDNYMWSQAVLRMAFAGSSIGEIFNAYPELKDAATDYDNEAWFRVWHDLGERLVADGTSYLESGWEVSAHDTLYRGCLNLQWAIAFMDHDDQRRHDVHRTSVDIFKQVAGLVGVEYVEVPYEDSSYPALFIPAEGGSAAHPDGMPAIFHMPGWDSTKEQGYTFAREMARRGIATLLVDAPGIGEAVLFRGMVNRYDYDVAGTAAFDYLAGRGDVDAKRIAAVGASMGGYRSARTAAFEHRLAGAVAWGAIWDYYAVWDKRLQESERAPLPTPHAHAFHVMGATDTADLRAKLEPFKLEDVAHQIKVPFLTLHGELDAQIPVEQAYKLHEAISSEDKTLMIFTKETGGTAHCQNDNRILAIRAVGDWLYDRLVRTHTG